MSLRPGPAARAGAVVRAAYAVGLTAAIAWALLVLLAASSSGTLGYDYRAYDLAVENLFAGRTMYDPTVQEMGAFGLFFYPPPFALMVVPFALLPVELAIVVWTGLLVAASVTAVWLLPVSARVRWIMLLLAALSWPLVFAIKLGQVGPLILLTFAAGWRWLDRPAALGLSAALGTVIKIQPALLVGWALVAGRRRAAVIAIAAIALLAAIASLVAGPRSWFEEADLLARVSKPLTPHTFGAGRLLLEAGASESLALMAHVANLALVALVTAYATWRASAVASYLAVVIASQFLSPVLWDHYALVLLLPTAWLLARGRSWAVLIPLVTSTVLVALPVPSIPWVYPAAFWVALLAVAREGIADRRSLAPAASVDGTLSTAGSGSSPRDSSSPGPATPATPATPASDSSAAIAAGP